MSVLVTFRFLNLRVTFCCNFSGFGSIVDAIIMVSRVLNRTQIFKFFKKKSWQWRCLYKWSSLTFFCNFIFRRFTGCISKRLAVRQKYPTVRGIFNSILLGVWKCDETQVRYIAIDRVPKFLPRGKLDMTPWLSPLGAPIGLCTVKQLYNTII